MEILSFLVFNNGFICQWGLTEGDPSIKVHTLPTSFKSHYGVVAIDVARSTNGLEMISLGVHDYAKTLSTFTIIGITSRASGCSWIALGI